MGKLWIKVAHPLHNDNIKTLDNIYSKKFWPTLSSFGLKSINYYFMGGQGNDI